MYSCSLAVLNECGMSLASSAASSIGSRFRPHNLFLAPDSGESGLDLLLEADHQFAVAGNQALLDIMACCVVMGVSGNRIEAIIPRVKYLVSRLYMSARHGVTPLPNFGPRTLRLLNSQCFGMSPSQASGCQRV